METVAGLERSFNTPAKFVNPDQLRCAVLGVFTHGFKGNVAPSTTIYNPGKGESTVRSRNERVYIKSGIFRARAGWPQAQHGL